MAKDVLQWFDVALEPDPDAPDAIHSLSIGRDTDGHRVIVEMWRYPGEGVDASEAIYLTPNEAIQVADGLLIGMKKRHMSDKSG